MLNASAGRKRRETYENVLSDGSLFGPGAYTAEAAELQKSMISGSPTCSIQQSHPKLNHSAQPPLLQEKHLIFKIHFF